MRKLKYAVLLLIIISVLGQASNAATPISACGTISSPGEYVLTTDIMNSGASTCISITSSDVTFDGSGYMIDGQHAGSTKGVYVYNSTKALTNVTVKNLILTDWVWGIRYNNAGNGSIINNTATSNTDGIELISSSNNNTFVGNNFSSNTEWGLHIFVSTNNNLTNNTANSNTDYGIYIQDSSNNTLTDNTANSNTDYGIYIQSSSNNTLINNTANSNYIGISFSSSNNNSLTNNIVSSNSNTGIYISSSNDNTLANNIASSNTQYGIVLESYSDNNTLTNNTVSSNSKGIYIDRGTYNALTNSTVSNNTQYGIKISSSNSNTIYNNYFNNSINVSIVSGSNYWNTSNTTGANIVGGSNLGGNFWAYPNGTGFSQTCADANSDGICDSSYTLAAGNIDYLPLSLNSASDTTPPASVTSLTNISYASNYINWTWSDPADSDFANVTVYLNGTFKENISKGVRYYNASGLSPDSAYEIETRTVDTSGNVNSTWMNHTARTATAATPTPTPTPTPTLTPTSNPSSGGSSSGHYPYGTATATPRVTATATPSVPKLTVIKVSPPNASVIAGKNLIFTASTYDQSGSLITVPVSWSSGNNSVGTIDSTGVFTALAPGNTTITARSGNVSGTAVVTVTPAKDYRLWLIMLHGFSDIYHEKGIANPNTSGISSAERNYKLSLNLHDSGVGGRYSENGHKLYLVPLQGLNMYQEKGYRINFIVNPTASGFSTAEGNFKISLNLYDSGVGGRYSENMYKLYLVPLQAHISYSNGITVNDPITSPAQSLLDYVSGKIGSQLKKLVNFVTSIL